MKLLITGAAGFVASSLINYFNRFNYEIHITGIDDFSYGYKERIKDLDDWQEKSFGSYEKICPHCSKEGSKSRKVYCR